MVRLVRWFRSWFVREAPESMFLRVMAGDYSAFLEGGVA